MVYCHFQRSLNIFVSYSTLHRITVVAVVIIRYVQATATATKGALHNCCSIERYTGLYSALCVLWAMCRPNKSVN